jgi:TPP-dependent pyruvate/acetoin dehydrogenase alpha subunit
MDPQHKQVEIVRHINLLKMDNSKQQNLWSLYGRMFQSRLFEEAVSQLWVDGLISGEMHLGTGEEAIIAGVLDHLQDGDAMALDHRGTAPLLMRGVDPFLILRELMGHPEGLCGGKGGHMHLFSKEHLAASSGIVGSSGPAAVGFALAARYLRPGKIAVAFFGEGAMNQGMLMESMNLAAVWNLPVLFVCKDDNWSITTNSAQTTGGSLPQRVSGLGLSIFDADGRDVDAVWHAAQEAIDRLREGQGPAFLHTKCVHLDAHFLGFQLVRVARYPLKEIPGIILPLIRSFLQPGGASIRERYSGVKLILQTNMATRRDARLDASNDPIVRTRQGLVHEAEKLGALESTIREEIATLISTALLEVSS